MTALQALKPRLLRPGRTTLAGVPQGLDAMLIPEIAAAAGKRVLVHVAADDQRAALLADQLAYFAPKLEVLRFPAWDCLPYDRVSPVPDIVARRLATLARLREPFSQPVVLLTTIAAVLQRVVPQSLIAGHSLAAAPGNRLSSDKLISFLSGNGFSRAGTVVEPGDFAVRGGIIDIFPPGAEAPVRLDFFGDTLESIRSFDPQSQRTTATLQRFALNPASEVLLNPEAIGRFRVNYAQAFGGIDTGDPLYESITSARKYQGMEHWLPLFHDRLSTLFDYLDDPVISLDHMADEAAKARQEQVAEFYNARREALDNKQTYGAAPYKPVKPDTLYVSEAEWAEIQSYRTVLAFSPFESPDAISFGGRRGRSFAAERSQPGGNVYEAVKTHAEAIRRAGRRVAIACWTEGSRERLETILKDHEMAPLAAARDWPEFFSWDKAIAGLLVLGLEEGFETADFAVIAEQDILGDRMVRRGRRNRKASDFLSELSALSPGDLVVHVDHGIGRFEGLKAIEVQGAPHDCLFLSYAGGDRLFLPVENIELLSRYGSEEQGVQLDRLGGGAWQARKAKLKERILRIAEGLIRTAAARELKAGAVLPPPEGAYEEFCARFPYEETEDQLAAIDAVIEDLQKGRPMDRLVCGKCRTSPRRRSTGWR